MYAPIVDERELWLSVTVYLAGLCCGLHGQKFKIEREKPTTLNVSLDPQFERENG